MDAIASEISEALKDTTAKLYSISSLAVALRHMLGSLDGRDEQPLVSAIELCSMIEDIAQTEANRIGS